MTEEKRSNADPAHLTRAMFYILLALVDHELHGYGIMQEVSTRTDHDIRLAPGTLYRSIKQLVAVGLIAESAERPDPALDDERRRYYRITPAGHATAESEARRLDQLVTMARSKQLLRAKA